MKKNMQTRLNTNIIRLNTNIIPRRVKVSAMNGGFVVGGGHGMVDVINCYYNSENTLYTYDNPRKNIFEIDAVDGWEGGEKRLRDWGIDFSWDKPMKKEQLGGYSVDSCICNVVIF